MIASDVWRRIPQPIRWLGLPKGLSGFELAFADLNAALLEHLALFFHEQPMTPPQQVALAERFGLPVHAIGVGETAEDLRPFAADDFANGLMGLER